MEASPHRHHGIEYVELAVADTAAAKTFYGSAFGWTFNDYGPGYVGYCDGREHGGKRVEAGGFILAEKPAAPLAVLYSSTLETTRDAVIAAGGTIAKEIFTFPGGRRFEFRDPTGNLLAVWSDR